MATIFPVRTGVGRAEIPALCAALATLLHGREPDVVLCEVAGPGPPGVATVEALARLRLTAQRHGWQLRVHGMTTELHRLIALLGLTATLPADGDAGP
ncbi:STAS domain-containing protein [Actinoplanes missouriensis]|uniref:STAS domain-containing protein n=1 Tax=Actinoplanes missouriensis TaxID=1866 RepID=UPI0033E686B7